MRSKAFLPVSARLAFAVVVTAFLSFVACRESTSVTGPSNGTSSPSAVSVSGNWTGTFAPDDPLRCSGSPASATFQQNGSEVIGSLTTSQCGVTGQFRGTMRGNTVLGKISMQGCTGGGVSGTIEGSRLTLSIGDLTKPLVTGETPVMTGGIATLNR